MLLLAIIILMFADWKSIQTCIDDITVKQDVDKILRFFVKGYVVCIVLEVLINLMFLKLYWSEFRYFVGFSEVLRSATSLVLMLVVWPSIWKIVADSWRTKYSKLGRFSGLASFVVISIISMFVWVLGTFFVFPALIGFDFFILPVVLLFWKWISGLKDFPDMGKLTDYNKFINYATVYVAIRVCLNLTDVSWLVFLVFWVILSKKIEALLKSLNSEVRGVKC